jgi:glycosyltransferase involved in cell wall biosynthesis
MKVCFTTYDKPSDVGGVSAWLQRVLPLLQAVGIEPEVHVMAFGGKPGVNCAFFQQHGIPVRWMPSEMLLPHAVRSLLRFLEESQPDVYVSNSIVPAYYAAGYARRAGIATIGVLHSDDPFYWGVVDEFMKGDPDFRLSAVVAVSKFLESQISSIGAALGVMVRRIGCGVPIPTKSAELSGSVFRLVYIGRLVEEQKRISDVTDALCSVTQSVPHLEAWIVGEGDGRRAVEDIIRERGMGARVHLLGAVANAHIYDVLAACHCLVLLSDYEGLPVSVLEGMATGVVPICLNTRSGVREAIENGVNGLIVKDRGADFFANVRELQRDRAKWRQLSMAARSTARQRYSIEECAREWVDLLEHLTRETVIRPNFRAPRIVRLPPPNEKFGNFGIKITWSKRMRHYVRSSPPLYRMAKATVALGRNVKSEVDRV